MWFQHTATRRWLGIYRQSHCDFCCVSTHSHPKVAGSQTMTMHYIRNSFNTQPPEGGWPPDGQNLYHHAGFNTQPPEGGWVRRRKSAVAGMVSTHSHPKVAGSGAGQADRRLSVSTHSHPKVAGVITIEPYVLAMVSTHSHPKVAGASLKSLVPSGFEAPISLSFQEKREREYNTAFSVTPSFTTS